LRALFVALMLLSFVLPLTPNIASDSRFAEADCFSHCLLAAELYYFLPP